MTRKTILNTALVATVLGAALTPVATHSQIYVRIGPPRPFVERRPPPFRPGWAWRTGYHRWDGRSYVWVPGAYVAPPRPRAVWYDGAWIAGPRGYYWREGYWR